MFTDPKLTLDLALARHKERIAAAKRWRQARPRRAAEEPATQTTRRRPTSTALPDGRFRNRRNADLAHWLIRVGDVVVQYPTAELDGHRRPALGLLVNELLDAARDHGADVPPDVAANDPAVMLLRTLGRLAESTAGGSIPISRRRARMLRTALDEFVDCSVDQVSRSRSDEAA